jgi:hypothetical protein
MITDILLALAGAVIATIGILTTPKAVGKSILIGAAILVAVLSVWKSQADNQDKEAIAELVGCETRPPGKGYNRMHEDVKNILKRIDSKFDPEKVDYSYVDEGMVFTYGEEGNKQPLLLFDGCQRGELYRNTLVHKSNEQIIKDALNQNLALDPYDDDIYSRITVLFVDSIMRLTKFEPLNFTYDEKGFRAVVYSGQIVDIPVEKLPTSEKNFSRALPAIEQIFTQEITEQLAQQPSKRN